MSDSTTISTRETRIFLAQVQDVLQQIAVLVRNSYFHDLSNQVFEEPLEKLRVSLGPVMAGEGYLRLERVGQELYANGARIRMELRTVHSYKFVADELEKRGLGGLAFESGLTGEGLLGFLSLLAAAKSLGEGSAEDFNERLEARNISAIRVLPTREDEGSGLDAAPDRRERAIRAYQEALDFIRKSVTELESPVQVNQRRAKRVIHKLVDLAYEEGDGFSVLGLASIKDHDHYTFNHMVNVCILSIAFGHRLGLARQALAELGICALYHDMGKLHIPVEVLNKPGKLSEEEWALMGNHTVFGARALFPQLAQDLRVVKRILTALQHHLGFDGKGYPYVRLLRKQTLYARIVAVVDLYDAMTTKRVYQDEFLPDGALKRMQELSGAYLDPLLVKAFVNCMGIFPVGSTVQLDTGEIAVVVEANPDPDRVDRPKVRMVLGSSWERLDPVLVDLAGPEHLGGHIVRCVDPEKFGINSAHFVM